MSSARRSTCIDEVQSGEVVCVCNGCITDAPQNANFRYVVSATDAAETHAYADFHDARVEARRLAEFFDLQESPIPATEDCDDVVAYWSSKNGRRFLYIQKQEV